MRDKAELCAAMDAHGGMVYRLALCRLGSRSDAEDVYQDVFLRLFQDETCFTDDAHLRAWLIRVTLNDCRDLRRSAWFRAAHRSRTGQPRRRCPRVTDLWNAVASLPEELRTAIYLYYVEGYGTEEIASLTGCRPTTVRTRLHRARKRLKHQLEEDRYEVSP